MCLIGMIMAARVNRQTQRNIFKIDIGVSISGVVLVYTYITGH